MVMSRRQPRGLTNLSYDTVSGLTSSITITGETSFAALNLVYGGNARRSRATLVPSNNQPIERTVSLTGLQGETLATQVTQNGTVTAVSNFINGNDGPFAVVDATNSTAYLLTDHLGTPQVTVRPADSSNMVPSAYTVMPFGTPQQEVGQPVTNLGFTGQRLDASSGLYNYNARLYDPELGRFYAADPVASPTSPYAYVGNDPLNVVDPSGMTGTKRKFGSDGPCFLGSGRTTASRLLIENGFLLARITYHLGQYAWASRERALMGVTGEQFEAEHIIGYAVLVLNTGLFRGSAGWATRIENIAPAYQEAYPFHRAHVGTGSGVLDLLGSGFTSDTYRYVQRAFLETGQADIAMQLNQLAYAFLPGFRNAGGEADQADGSYINMILNLDSLTYAAQTAHGLITQTWDATCQIRAELLVGRWIARTGIWPTIAQMTAYLARIGLDLQGRRLGQRGR